MITADDAKAIVLQQIEAHQPEERFAIQSCELSSCGDYWAICANSEDYVLRGMFERCYIGVSAYLVDSVSGDVEIVSSRTSWQTYLNDKYDLEHAGGLSYVLEPAFDKTQKTAVINLRQKLALTYPETLALLSPEKCRWLTGKLRVLRDAQRMLREQGIETEIHMREDRIDAKVIDETIWHWDLLVSQMRA
jgi:hypothetical protein